MKEIVTYARINYIGTALTVCLKLPYVAVNFQLLLLLYIVFDITMKQNSWRMYILFSVLCFQIHMSNSEPTRNSLVSCTACQTVQVQNFVCDVNCQVVKGNKGTQMFRIQIAFKFFLYVKV